MGRSETEPELFRVQKTMSSMVQRDVAGKPHRQAMKARDLPHCPSPHHEVYRFIMWSFHSSLEAGRDLRWRLEPMKGPIQSRIWFPTNRGQPNAQHGLPEGRRPAATLPGSLFWYPETAFLWTQAHQPGLVPGQPEIHSSGSSNMSLTLENPNLVVAPKRKTSLWSRTEE